MKFISLYSEWYNAFGEGISQAPVKGEMLTYKDTKHFNGMRFLEFEEMPKGYFYLATGFREVIRTKHSKIQETKYKNERLN